MRLGIYLNIERDCGGMYQACLNMVETIYKLYANQALDEVIIFAHHSNLTLTEEFTANNFSVVNLPEHQESIIEFLRRKVNNPVLRRIMRFARHHFRKKDLDVRRIDHNLDNFIKSYQIDCMLFPNWDPQAYRQTTKFITFVPDIEHRIKPQFDEVGNKYVFFDREYNVYNLVKHCSVLIVDSPAAVEDMRYYYAHEVQDKPIKVLRYRLSDHLKIDLTSDEVAQTRKKYNLPERFFFYPAQFWEHKNHRRIIEALFLLKQRFNLNIPIVFCGSHTGIFREKCYRELQKLVDKLDLNGQVHFLSYVSDLDISVLYNQAVALLMPSCFGPANIPIVEAWSVNCPVIYSQIHGLRDQAQNAALLVDPYCSSEIADAVKQLWEDENQRQNLIKAGQERLKSYSKEAFEQSLKEIIECARIECLNK